MKNSQVAGMRQREQAAAAFLRTMTHAEQAAYVTANPGSPYASAVRERLALRKDAGERMAQLAERVDNDPAHARMLYALTGMVRAGAGAMETHPFHEREALRMLCEATSDDGCAGEGENVLEPCDAHKEQCERMLEACREALRTGEPDPDVLERATDCLRVSNHLAKGNTQAALQHVLAMTPDARADLPTGVLKYLRKNSEPQPDMHELPTITRRELFGTLADNNAAAGRLNDALSRRVPRA